MKNKENYPLNYAFISNRPSEAERIVKNKKPHKGTFVGLELLEGTFPECDGEKIFKELSFGEQFSVCCDNTGKIVTPLEVKREDGIIVGYLPFAVSVLLTSLMERGLKCFCFLEAKDETSGILSVAVSVYCEKY